MSTSARFGAWVNKSPLLKRFLSHNALYICRFRSYLSAPKRPDNALSALRYAGDAGVVSGVDSVAQALSQTVRGDDRVFVSLENGEELSRLVAHLVSSGERARDHVFCVHVRCDTKPLSSSIDCKVHYRLPANSGSIYCFETRSSVLDDEVFDHVLFANIEGRPGLILNAFGDKPAQQVDLVDRRAYVRIVKILAQEKAKSVSIISNYARDSLKTVLAEADIAVGGNNVDAIVTFADGGRTTDEALARALEYPGCRVLVVYRAQLPNKKGISLGRPRLHRPIQQMPILAHLANAGQPMESLRRQGLKITTRRYTDRKYRSGKWWEAGVEVEWVMESV